MISPPDSEAQLEAALFTFSKAALGMMMLTNSPV